MAGARKKLTAMVPAPEKSYEYAVSATLLYFTHQKLSQNVYFEVIFQGPYA
jgi:hypothetical protein